MKFSRDVRPLHDEPIGSEVAPKLVSEQDLDIRFVINDENVHVAPI